MNWKATSICLLAAVVATTGFAQEKKTREQQVREDRDKVTAGGFWIYNDLPKAFAEAKETGKPILVILRCIPCEECVKLDDDLVDQDPVLKPLLEKFVCVRVVSTNGLDLSLFQFDTDQSFAAFMLNADRTIYGRFGTRSHRTEWVGDVSLKGLAATLEGAMELHAAYPANKATLADKTGPAPLFAQPELFPSLRDKFTDSLNYSGDVAKSCIHCHQIGDAVRDYYRTRKEPIPDSVLNPYPHPKSLGLVLDPTTRGTVKSVASESVAAASGFKPGDEIRTMSGQPILSMSDVQWVLHQAPASGTQIEVAVVRDGADRVLKFDLPEGWRELDDISWRVSAWGLRRMVTGGLSLEPVRVGERGKDGVPRTGMALRVKGVGQYGPHAAAKNAGFQKDDIIVAFDGRTDLFTDSAVLRYGATACKAGESVDVAILRSAKPMTLKMPMQE